MNPPKKELRPLIMENTGNIDKSSYLTKINSSRWFYFFTSSLPNESDYFSQSSVKRVERMINLILLFQVIVVTENNRTLIASIIGGKLPFTYEEFEKRNFRSI